MNKWLIGLINAIIGGAAVSIVAYVATPTTSFKALGIVALIGAVVAVANYVQQYPIPLE